MSYEVVVNTKRTKRKAAEQGKPVTPFIKSVMRAQDGTNCITEGIWSFELYCNAVLTRRLPSIVLRRAEGNWRTRYIFCCEKGPLHGAQISFKDISELACERQALNIVLTPHRI